jgi:hypothetical protein
MRYTSRKEGRWREKGREGRRRKYLHLMRSVSSLIFLKISM